MKILGRGAEANLYLDGGRVLKKRISKGYRIKKIDESLRKSRTKREAKVLSKLKNVPKVFDVNDFTIVMQHINGKLLRDVFDKDGLKYCEAVGKLVREIHDKEVIHGDLTTSNMIIYKKKVYFIDFGLSFFSQKVEDKAVDLHLLKQALMSKHYMHWRKAFDLVWKGYNPDRVFIERFYKVESRGRYKRKKK